MGHLPPGIGTGPRAGQDSAGRAEDRSDLSAQFQIPLDNDKVDTQHLLVAAIWESPLLTADATRREIGGSYYPKLQASLTKKYGKAEIIVTSMAGMVLALGVGKPDEFEILINRAVIQFDWAEAEALLIQINELVDEVQRWISDSDERYGLLTTLFGIASQIQTSIARENALALEQENGNDDPSKFLARDIEKIEPQIERARQQFLDDAQRGAQLRYAKGMAYGGLGLLVVTTLLGIGFLYGDVRAVNGIGLFAGGIGACVSVLQRMTSGTLVLNFQTVDRMLVAFGALRPFVGGVFGIVIFCVLEAGLISAIVLPTDLGQQLSFVAVFAFAAGFNERFFQDMLARASQNDSIRLQDRAPDA